MNEAINIMKKKCKLCSSNNINSSDIYFSNHDFEFIINCCKDCGFESKYLISDNIDDIYRFIYDEGSFVNDRGDDNKVDSLTTERAYLMPIVDKLSNSKSQPTLCEIGPGAGRTCLYASRLGVEVTAMDVSISNRDYYEKMGLYRVVDNIDNLQEEYFDMIIMTHVLEHIENPKEFIECLKGKIKSGGLLVVSVPNVNTIFKRFFGFDYWVYLVDDHLSFFNKRLLVRMLNDIGFNTVSAKTDGSNATHSLHQGYLSKYKNMHNKRVYCEKESSTVNMNHSKGGKLFRSMKKIFDLIWLPFSWFGMGYEIVIVCQKK
jgi:SAM-dependent methyltransferase